MKLMNKALVLPLVLLALLLAGCEEGDGGSDFVSNYAQGIRDALTEGAKSAVTKGGTENGYYENALLKIGMPDEALSAVSRIDGYMSNSTVKGFINEALSQTTEYDSWDGLKEGIVLSFNRAAERAAGFESSESREGTIKGTFDIFADAITALTIDEAVTILKGYVPGDEEVRADDETVEARKDAATEYLKTKTYTDLQTLFSKIIDEVLDENLITVNGTGYSVNQVWSWFVEFCTEYNGLIDGSFVFSSSYKVDVPPAEISEYVTGKALDGLFILLAEAEEAIRDNPIFSGASDFLIDAFEYAQDIFGDAI